MRVQAGALLDREVPAPPSEPSALDELRASIDQAAHLLPAQGPITSFVHHNTLHAFEDLPFNEAVEEGARIFHCEPYLGEAEYRVLLERERIRVKDLRAVLLDDLGEYADGLIGGLGTRYHLRLAMLELYRRPGGRTRSALRCAH